ncbi:cupin domain-containing protein [Phormidium tenue]|uniref:Cupin n=1 Tax=Phormidium tenue NIES-30 TaxID=549789 RepID=A0A1U7J544_9CYAN|nr:cupin domain-containing protein [Phormidium tenue]MBD2232649.1 cupin domain-containing protein [Phormidium tenue FACHB-1052]OKH47779.1 cupin [Phormidium tenue NIES-30]
MSPVPASGNLFQLPDPLPAAELFTALFETPHLRVERILSTGQTTPPNEWYDQSQDEWVVLLQGSATLTYEDGASLVMGPGDYVLIPAHRQHRVSFTSSDPPCVWLAIHCLK